MHEIAGSCESPMHSRPPLRPTNEACKNARTRHAISQTRRSWIAECAQHRWPPDDDAADVDMTTAPGAVRTGPDGRRPTHASFLGGSPMPFPHFSGPPSRLRVRARNLFRGKSKVVYCFPPPGPPERLGEPARTLVRKKSYAVSSLFGPAQSFSGARPKVFFLPGEVLCRLLIFRVHPGVSGSQPERLF